MAKVGVLLWFCLILYFCSIDTLIDVANSPQDLNLQHFASGLGCHDRMRERDQVHLDEIRVHIHIAVQVAHEDKLESNLTNCARTVN